jgi:hypothetical protein
VGVVDQHQQRIVTRDTGQKSDQRSPDQKRVSGSIAVAHRAEKRGGLNVREQIEPVQQRPDQLVQACVWEL